VVTKTCKTCITCSKSQPESQFRLRTKRGSTYRMGVCLTCERIARRAWYWRDKGKVEVEEAPVIVLPGFLPMGPAANAPLVATLGQFAGRVAA
jgi:hypothetical protein